MRPATDTEFLAAPVGRCVLRRSWVLWCVDVGCCGSVFWGRPDKQDVTRFFRVSEALFDLPINRGLGVLTDASRLEGIDPAVFQRLTRFAATRFADLERRTRQHALIRPAGFAGAVVTGFYEIIGRPSYPERVFTEARQALSWLGRDDAGPLAEEIAALAITARAVPDVVRRLRDRLATNLDLPLAVAARALGTSERSLQRQLRRAGTSFRTEIQAARIRAAQTLLAETDQKITSIALEVGCATPQHFGTLFRKLTGQTPSAWRARRQS